MQLFGSNNQSNKKKTVTSQEFIEGRISGFSVAIISTRKSIIDNIRSVLFLYNVLSIEVLQLELEDIKEDPRWREFDVFIIDINEHNDGEQIAAHINRYIPIKSTTILVGSNDSIIFADLLVKKGIHFLLENKQIENIPNVLYTRSITTSGSSKRIGSVVTFLGCKGGIGTSSLIVHILKNLSHSTSYPILYIQGASTSRNADFLFEQPIDKDGSFSKVGESIQVKIEQDEEQWRYDYLNSDSFNITILEQNMGLNSSLNQLESIISLSNIVFLVLNRDPYSVKIAKSILDEINRLHQKDQQILNKRFLICVNDNQPIEKKSSLQIEDIEEFIGRPVNFTRKYIANSEKFKKAYNSAEISDIASAVIGVKNENKRRSLLPFLNKKKKSTKTKKNIRREK